MPHWALPRAATSTQLMVRVAAEHGLPAESCLAGTGLTQQELDDPASEIRGQQELEVLRNILRALTPEVPFALQAGMSYRPTTHGMWGFALISSRDGRSAVEVGLHYFELSYSFNRVRFEEEGREARFVYDSSDNPDDLQAALVQRDMAALLAMTRDLHGAVLPPRAIQLRTARPAYASAFWEVFGLEPRFGAERDCYCFDAAILDMRQPLADDFGRRVSEEQCRLLIDRRGARAGIAGKVRAEIVRKAGQFPSMKEVATQLGMSTRTLHNRLARDETSDRELVEEIRETLAEELLSASRLSVDEVAQRVGYADTSSFVAAFKRWKGVPPGGYKRIFGSASGK
jgi:AraC-like DNA-binding protein